MCSGVGPRQWKSGWNKEVAARVAEEVKRLEESFEECVAERVSEEMKRREGGRVE